MTELTTTPAAPKARGRRPKAAPPAVVTLPEKKRLGGKLGELVSLMKRQEGASIREMMEATGWQQHSVRGAIAGSIKKKLGLNVYSEKQDGVRTYRIASEEA